MVLNTLSLAGLLLIYGSVSFYYFIWSGTEDKQLIIKKSIFLLFLGGILYLFYLLTAVFLDHIDSSTNLLILRNVNLLLVPLFMTIFLLLTKERNRNYEVSLLITGILILVLHTFSTDTIQLLGVFPYITQIIHLASSLIWSGCVLIIVLLPWSKILNEIRVEGFSLNRILIRFSVLSIIALTLILLTGAILAVSNVHNMDVINSTGYGRVLSLKVFLVAILFLFMLIEYTRRPLGSEAKTNHTHSESISLLKRFRGATIFKGLLLLSTLGISILLSTNTPPDTPPFLNPQTWHLNAGEHPVSIDMQPVAGSTTQIRFEIFMPEELMETQGTTVNYDLYLVGSEIGTFGANALQASLNSFLGESVIPMPGEWKLDLHIVRPGLSELTGSMDIDIPSIPLIEDLKTYLSISAIKYSSARSVTFFIGTMLVFVYLWISWRSQQGKMARKYTMIGVSVVVLGMYMLMSVLLVKTYPSTYWKNPQPYNAGTISSGQSAYLNECSECHGDSGLGDGVWAVENRGRIPSLSSPHIDVHTDGEIYWWITYGIPSLEMPPLEEELNQDERWQIINYIRSLRHGIP